MFSYLSNPYWLLLYTASMPVSIMFTLVLFNLIFYTDKNRSYVESLQKLLNEKLIVVFASVIALLSPLFLILDFIVIVYLALVIYPTKFTFSLLNKYNRNR